MPERKTAETEVQNFAKSLEAQLGSMTAEYQQSLQEYQANEDNLSAEEQNVVNNSNEEDSQESDVEGELNSDEDRTR